MYRDVLTIKGRVLLAIVSDTKRWSQEKIQHKMF